MQIDSQTHANDVWGRGRRWKWMARSRPRAAECHCADHRCRSDHWAVRPQRPCLLLVCRSTHVRLFLPALPNNVPTWDKKNTTIASLFFWKQEISTPKGTPAFACRFRTCPGHNFRLLLTNISLAFKAHHFWLFSHNLTWPSSSNLIHFPKFCFSLIRDHFQIWDEIRWIFIGCHMDKVKFALK